MHQTYQAMPSCDISTPTLAELACGQICVSVPRANHILVSNTWLAIFTSHPQVNEVIW